MDGQSQQQLEVSQDQSLMTVEIKLSPAEGIIGRNGKPAQGRKELIDQKSRPLFFTAMMLGAAG